MNRSQLIRAIPLALMMLIAPSLATVKAATNPSTFPSAPPLRLWEKDAPGALGTADPDIPTLTPFMIADQKTLAVAFIVCPGGGYQRLSPSA